MLRSYCPFCCCWFAIQERLQERAKTSMYPPKPWPWGATREQQHFAFVAATQEIAHTDPVAVVAQRTTAVADWAGVLACIVVGRSSFVVAEASSHIEIEEELLGFAVVAMLAKLDIPASVSTAGIVEIGRFRCQCCWAKTL